MHPTDREPTPRSPVRAAPVPAIFPLSPVIPLTVPTATDPVSFMSVLDERHSIRQLASPSREELSELLWHAARTRDSQTREGVHWQSRATPSAGGIHPVHLILTRVGRDRRALRYDPLRHALIPCAISVAAVRRYLRAVDAVVATSGTVVTLLVDVAAIRRRYLRPESLAWRDAGCQLATLHLTAQALGLGSCLLGINGHLLAEGIRSPRLAAMGVLVVGRSTAPQRRARL